MTDGQSQGGTNRVVPVSALETYIKDKKGYADFIESTAAPDGVATEVRDSAVELERLVEERSIELSIEQEAER